MKNTNTAKKETSQFISQFNDQLNNQKNSTIVKSAKSSHIKIVKPRPNGSEASIQGPRDCFPLG